MGNTLTDIMPKILARGLLVLRKKLVMPQLVNSSYGTDAKEKGATIDVPLPAAQTAAAITPAATPPALVDKTPTKVQISLDQWYGSSFHLTDKDRQEVDARAHFLPMQTYSAVDAIAQTVNQQLCQLSKDIPTFVGTAGTTPFASDASAIINGRKALANQLAPQGDRRFVFDPNAEANMLALAPYANMYQSNDAAVMREGEVGRKYGFDHFMDQQVYAHVSTWAGTITVDGAQLAGVTVLNTTGGTTGAAIGDRFTIAGNTTQYVATAVNALGTGGAGKQAITIYPALAANAADTTAITKIASHTSNMAFHRDAFAFATRPLQDEAENDNLGSQISVAQDPQTGLAFRLEYARRYKTNNWEFDLLWGKKTVRPELAVLVLG